MRLNHSSKTADASMEQHVPVAFALGPQGSVGFIPSLPVGARLSINRKPRQSRSTGKLETWPACAIAEG